MCVVSGEMRRSRNSHKAKDPMPHATPLRRLTFTALLPFLTAAAWETESRWLESGALAAEPILHRFLALDESRKQLHLVDERDPVQDWTIALPDDARPRDFQVVGNHRALVASGGGYLECDLKHGRLIRQVECVEDMVISLRRLPNGNTLLMGRDSARIYELNRDDSVVRQFKLPADFARLMRFTPEGHLVCCPDSQIMEFSLQGDVIRVLPFRVGDDPRPAKRSGYHILKSHRGNYLASTCYAVSIVELHPSGSIKRVLGGHDHPQAESMHWVAFTGFQVLPNGHIVVTTWNGHGADDSHHGPQLIEFDKEGAIVWQWHDPQRAGSILGVVVLDALDASKRIEEDGHVLRSGASRVR